MRPQKMNENAVFPKLIIRLLQEVKSSEVLKLYRQFMSLINYAIVCGIGVLINTAFLYLFTSAFPLWLANFFAIAIAFLWNWSFTVGPFGYLWGFETQVEVEKKEKEEQES